MHFGCRFNPYYLLLLLFSIVLCFHTPMCFDPYGFSLLRASRCFNLYIFYTILHRFVSTRCVLTPLCSRLCVFDPSVFQPLFVVTPMCFHTHVDQTLFVSNPLCFRPVCVSTLCVSNPTSLLWFDPCVFQPLRVPIPLGFHHFVFKRTPSGRMCFNP